MSGKIRKHDIFDTVSPSSTVSAIIKLLQRAEAAEASGEWTEIEIEYSVDDYYSGEWSIVGYRMETDREYQIRMKELAKAKTLSDKQKEKEKIDERKLYEKLKKKYEGK